MATNQEILEAIRKKYNKEEKENDLNLYQKFMAGITQGIGNVGEGVIKGAESVIDLGAGIIGSGAELLGYDNVSDNISDFVKHNYTKDILQSDAFKNFTYYTGGFATGLNKEQLNKAYSGDNANYLPEIIDVLTQQGGNMLAMASGSSIAGPIGLVSTVGGTGTEQALNDGGGIVGSTLYGTASGTVEALAEKYVGKLFGKLTGGGSGKIAGLVGNSSVGKGSGGLGTALLRIGRNFTEEGTEEVVSDVLNPILQMSTYKRDVDGSNFFEKYKTLFQEQGGFEGLAESFVLGGLMGGIFEGTSTALGSSRMKSLRAYNYTVEANNIIETNREMRKALADGDSKKYNSLLAQKQKNLDRVADKYSTFLDDVKNGKITTFEVQSTIEQIESELNKDVRQELGQDIAQGILGEDVLVELSKDENLKGSNYNPNTKTITLKDSQVNVENFHKVLMHEIGHASNSENLTNELINGIDESSYNKMFEETKAKYIDEIKGMTDEEAKAYIDEEISSNILGDMFNNTNDFLRSVNELNSRGLSKLIKYIKNKFKNKPKPSNYKKVMDILDKSKLKTLGEVRFALSEDPDFATKQIYEEFKKERGSSFIDVKEKSTGYNKINKALTALSKNFFDETTKIEINEDILSNLEITDLTYLVNILDEYCRPMKDDFGGIITETLYEIDKIKNPIDKNVLIGDLYYNLSLLNESFKELISQFLSMSNQRALKNNMLSLYKKAESIYYIKDVVMNVWSKFHTDKKAFIKKKKDRVESSLKWNEKDEYWKELKQENDFEYTTSLSSHKATKPTIEKLIKNEEKANSIKNQFQEQEKNKKVENKDIKVEEVKKDEVPKTKEQIKLENEALKNKYIKPQENIKKDIKPKTQYKSAIEIPTEEVVVKPKVEEVTQEKVEEVKKPKPKVEKKEIKEVKKPKPKVESVTEQKPKVENIVEQQVETAKKETNPKKSNEVSQLNKALSRLETEQDVTKITKTIDGKIKTIYIATRAKSVPDNAKTVKLSAELFNDQVYPKIAAKEIIDNTRKYLTERREAGLIFDEYGQEWAQNDIFVIMNEIDSVKSKEIKIEEITNYLVSRLNLDIKNDNYVKSTIKQKVKDIMNTHSSKSERAKLLEKQEKNFNKKIVKLVKSLNDSQNEINRLANELEKATNQLDKALENNYIDDKRIDELEQYAIKVVKQLSQTKDNSSRKIEQLKQKFRETRLLKDYLKSEVKRLKISKNKYKEKVKTIRKEIILNERSYNSLKNKKNKIIENNKSKSSIYKQQVNELISDLPEYITRQTINNKDKTLRKKLLQVKSKFETVKNEIENETGVIPSVELNVAFANLDKYANSKRVTAEEMKTYDIIVDNLLKYGIEANKERVFNIVGFENRKLVGTKRQILNKAKTCLTKAKNVVGSSKVKRKLFSIVTNVSSPRLFFKLLDGYDKDGVMTTLYDSLRIKETKKIKKQSEYENKLFDFLGKKENKAFRKKLFSDKDITIDNKTATFGEWVELYNLLQQEDSVNILYNENSHIKIGGTIYSNLTLEEISSLKEKVTKYLLNVEGFKKFDELVVDMLDMCRDDKVTTDINRLGVTNALEKGKRYYPIFTIQELRHQTFDQNGNIQFISSKDLSFNKSRTHKNMTIEIHNVMNTLLNYSKGMAFYTTCYSEIENMQSILQAHIEPGISYIAKLNEVMSTPSKPRFVIDYLVDFFGNYQGYKRERDWFTTLKSKASAYYIAGNISSILRQSTSYWASSRYIDVYNPKINIQLLSHNFKELDIYKPDSIKYRNIDSILMYQREIKGSMIDKINDKLFAITSAVDKSQMELIWRASLIQSGVFENGISNAEKLERIGKAQELSELAVRETQDNSMVTERSRMSLSRDWLSQSLTQFRSQPTQMFSTLVDAYFNIYAKKKNKSEITKEDKNNLIKAGYGIIISQALGVVIAMAIKGILDNDDEAKEPEEWVNQFIQELIGIIPVVGNFANIQFKDSKLEIGTYDFNVGPINLFIEGTQQLSNSFNDLIDNDGVYDFNNLVDGISKVLGIPYKNISRIVKGITNKIDNEFLTKTGVFYTGTKVNQKTLINNSIDEGNFSQAKAYYRIYTNQAIELEESVISAMFDTYRNGEETSVIKQIPKTITYDNEVYTVDSEKFRKTYSRVNKPLTQLTNNKTFKSMDYEEKAQCINKLVNLYYDLAKNEVVNINMNALHYLASSDYNLAKDIVHVVKISNMSSTSSKTKKEQAQQYINSLSISQNEKLLISYLSGYKLSESNINKVKSYLRQNMIPYKTIEKIFEEK